MAAVRVESTRLTVAGHLRVPKDVYDSLEAEARARGMSLNALVSQVLSTHTRDDRVLEQVGGAKMPREAFRLILSMVPDDKLSEYGSASATHVKNTMMIANSHGVDLRAVLDELRLASRCGWYSFHEAKKDGKTVITLVHDFGPRYSVVCAASSTALFGLVGVRPKITTTDSSVMIEY